jgi:hypothetical protein
MFVSICCAGASAQPWSWVLVTKSDSCMVPLVQSSAVRDQYQDMRNSRDCEVASAVLSVHNGSELQWSVCLWACLTFTKSRDHSMLWGCGTGTLNDQTRLRPSSSCVIVFSVSSYHGIANQPDWELRPPKAGWALVCFTSPGKIGVLASEKSFKIAFINIWYPEDSKSESPFLHWSSSCCYFRLHTVHLHQRILHSSAARFALSSA